MSEPDMKESCEGQLELELRTAGEHQLQRWPGGYSPRRSTKALQHDLHVYEFGLERQIDELRRTQLALEISHKRYLDLHELAPVGYLNLESDSRGRILGINLTGATLLGLDRKDLLQQPFVSFVSRDEQDHWSRHFSSVRLNDGSSCIELALRRANGTAFFAQLNCVRQRLDASDTTGVAGTVISVVLSDITQRKRAERESQHGALRIASFMQHANDCIIVFDADTIIIDASDSCLRVYGYTRDELIGMPAAQLRSPDYHDEFQRRLRQLKEQGSLSIETWHRRKDGSQFPVQVGATMIEVDGTRYVQGIVRDISESVRQRAELEQQLDAAVGRLAALSRHLVEAQEDARRKVSGELHDRSSPNLAAILINLRLIAQALPADVPAELSERLDDTRALIEDTDASIRDICAELRSPVLDHAGLPAAMEGYAIRYAKRTGLQVAFHCVNDQARLEPALESLLFRIFQEALTNTLKHAHAKAIKVTTNLDACTITLTIADDGVGFDVERQRTKAEPAGMGLVMMREMAEIAGGQLIIESQPGRGTRIEARIQS